MRYGKSQSLRYVRKACPASIVPAHMSTVGQEQKTLPLHHSKSVPIKVFGQADRIPTNPWHLAPSLVFDLSQRHQAWNQ
jgi:hypothetical protein